MGVINKKPQRSLPMSVAMSDFTRFLSTHLGRAVLAREKSVIDSQLPSLSGYNLLQLSVQKANSLSDSASVGHYIKMGFAPNVDPQYSDNLWADYEEFPIASDCIDIILLHHVLEFAQDPHQLLREANRTLTAGGHMVVLGFNPVSSWAIYRHCAKSGKGAYQAIRQSRLMDWMSVLNYDVLQQKSYFYRPPVNNEAVLKRLAMMDRLGERLHLPFGMFYVIVARKRAFPVNRIRPYWPRRVKPGQVATLNQVKTLNQHIIQCGDVKQK